MHRLDHVLRQLGLGMLRLADANILNGSINILFETGSSIYRDTRPPGGVNWRLPYQTIYPGELDRLLRSDASVKSAALPHVPLFLPDKGFDPRRVRLRLVTPDFSPRFRVTETLEIYKRNASRKMFFDGENARLIEAGTSRFSFQGSRYFDYISTNLSLDSGNTVFGTLRQQIHPRGLLEPISESQLANATGINGLVFSCDGHLVLQRRRDNVLIRPGELCSGFSGTVDKLDVSVAVDRGATLANLDATRELVEEIGVDRDQIGECTFLGVSRELVRGGKPEMFYAVDVNLTKSELTRCYPRDKEGDLVFVPFGFSGSSRPGSAAVADTLDLLGTIASCLKGQLSLPLMANLVLWQRWCRLCQAAPAG